MTIDLTIGQKYVSHIDHDSRDLILPLLGFFP